MPSIASASFGSLLYFLTKTLLIAKQLSVPV